MSATVTNDAFLVKGLRLSVDTITKPLVHKEERWAGEKMVLIPSLTHASLDRSAVVSEWAKPRTGRDYGVVALVPSFKMTADWEKYGSKVARKESIKMCIEALKAGHFDDPVVIANRYDGIDLPDSMCRVLIFDSKPYSEVLSDLYEENCRSSSEITAVRTARVIEQGLGRSVRGEKDYSAIIIIGPELVKFVRNTASRKHLSSQTRGQVEIGLQIAEMAEQEIKSGATPNGAIHGLVQQCLGRDEEWKAFYAQEMNTIPAQHLPTQILDIFKQEFEAELSYQAGEEHRAVAELQKLIDTSIKEPSDKCWYLQEMARYTFRSSKIESNKFQVAAHRGNRYLMKPRTGVEFTPLKEISQEQVAAISGWVKSHENFEQLMIAIDEILGRLEFGVKAERFEQAFKELGACLGFSSERPDKEWKEGPDNLWCVRKGDYLLVECKSEVALDRAEVNKDESGQMNNSCAWFQKNYPAANCTNILITPPNKLGAAAGFNKPVGIMRDKDLRNLRKNVKALFGEFKTSDFKDLSESKIQGFLDAHKLTAEAVCTQYVSAVRS
jgi:hypothetical protein